MADSSPYHDPPLPLTAHLRELRKRILISGVVILLVFLGCWAISEHILAVIKAPLLPYARPQFDTLTEGFFSHLKAALFAALFLTFPITLVQIWLFVSPGLYGSEKKTSWPFLLFSFPLFVGGGGSSTLSFFRSPSSSWSTTTPRWCLRCVLGLISRSACD